MKKYKYNTGSCLCRLWGNRTEDFEKMDFEILGYENYHFFPVFNNCTDDTEPVCYGLGEYNCVCENVKELNCNCDDVYNLCPRGYECKSECTEDLENTNNCGPLSDKPCIGVCRKSINTDVEDGYRNPTCNCYWAENRPDCYYCTDEISSNHCLSNANNGCNWDNASGKCYCADPESGCCAPGPYLGDGICPSESICINNAHWSGYTSCIYSENQCQYTEGFNIECNGQCKLASLDIYNHPGCMDTLALNFDPEAIYHCLDCCVYNVLGCTHITACNFNSAATIDDGSCEYNTWYEDTDGDGLGCPDLYVEACNNPDPNIYVDNNGGDCDDCPFDYDECGVCGGNNDTCSGCTDENACNYNTDAVFDDGTCFYIGDENYPCDCTGEVQLSAYYPDPDNDGIGCCELYGVDQAVYFCEYPGENWTLVCGEWDEYCECPDGTHQIDQCGTCYSLDEPAPNTCIGCTNPYALNYSALKTIDDGSCIFDWEQTTYMKVWYWSDDGYCGSIVGICSYQYWESGPGSSIINGEINTTEWQCQDLGLWYGLDDIISTSWVMDDSVEQPSCSVDDPFLTTIYVFPDGNFSTTLTEDGSVCPGKWFWNDTNTKLTFQYGSGTYFEIEDENTFTFDSLINGFHGKRYRYDGASDSMIEGGFYVRKWDFHPIIKGAPDGVFVDRVWSIDMHIYQPEGGSIKTLPVFESDRKWHSMNGDSKGEYEINLNTFKMLYNNATNDSCCYPELSIYKEESPSIGGGLVCSPYEDNIAQHQFPGCRSVIHSLNPLHEDKSSVSRAYTESSNFPGQIKLTPELVKRRNWAQIYDTNAALADVEYGSCDSNRINLWLYGLESELNPNAHIPQRNCLDPDFPNGLIGDMNGDGYVNVLDVVAMINFIVNQDQSDMPVDLFNLIDLNNDGLINILDTVMLINMILDTNSNFSLSTIVGKNTPEEYFLHYSSEDMMLIIQNLLTRFKKKQMKNINVRKTKILQKITNNVHNNISVNVLNSMSVDELEKHLETIKNLNK